MAGQMVNGKWVPSAAGNARAGVASQWVNGQFRPGGYSHAWSGAAIMPAQQQQPQMSYADHQQAMMNRIRDEYRKAFEEGRATNLQRYEDILAGYQDREKRGMGYLDTAGDQERKDVKQAGLDMEALVRQQAMNTGTYNTTILPTMLMGAKREAANMEGRLNDRLTQQRLATDMSLSGDTLAFKERRDDTYPDFNQLMQMEMMAGQGTLQGLAPWGGGGGGMIGGNLYGVGMPGGGMYAMPQMSMYYPQQQLTPAQVQKAQAKRKNWTARAEAEKAKKAAMAKPKYNQVMGSQAFFNPSTMYA